ncbi:MAG: ADP-glyceromanno-heptose 6-epimerase [Methylotenera sp.]|nr:MAG: ADP-glyceromanno-heptose 6-epimerase [Methylotenera sp.]
MIVITGGAGMIGSVIAWHLNKKLGRNDLVIVDHITHEEQWQNLVHRQYVEYLDKDQLFDFLDGNDGDVEIDAVIHMGAISATTERDYNKLVEANIHYSQDLWGWCAEHEVPFFYASSAATYGDGAAGYDDISIDKLRPLNGYGYSKHFFDQWALRQVAENAPQPPAWAGFKFFNVYGPNEYHKERMASVAFHTFNQVKTTGGMKLFKSNKADFADGMQMRDFVYVKDCADIIVHFFDQATNTKKTCKNGIYNIGTGKARSFKDLASAVMHSMDKTPHIDFIDMPEDLQGKYQYFTQANVAKLRAAGYTKPFTSLEDGVKDYVQNYLLSEDKYC